MGQHSDSERVIVGLVDRPARQLQTALGNCRLAEVKEGQAASKKR
jgi:hypothetical protein